jgi:hypothetical protein
MAEENPWLRRVTCVPLAGDVVMASLDHVLQRHGLKKKRTKEQAGASAGACYSSEG